MRFEKEDNWIDWSDGLLRELAVADHNCSNGHGRQQSSWHVASDCLESNGGVELRRQLLELLVEIRLTRIKHILCLVLIFQHFDLLLAAHDVNTGYFVLFEQFNHHSSKLTRRARLYHCLCLVLLTLFEEADGRDWVDEGAGALLEGDVWIV